MTHAMPSARRTAPSAAGVTGSRPPVCANEAAGIVVAVAAAAVTAVAAAVHAGRGTTVPAELLKQASMAVAPSATGVAPTDTAYVQGFESSAAAAGLSHTPANQTGWSSPAAKVGSGPSGRTHGPWPTLNGGSAPTTKRRPIGSAPVFTTMPLLAPVPLGRGVAVHVPL